MACYSSVMKVARQQARVKPLTTVGRLCKGGHDPDVGEMVVADGKSEAAVEENLAFTLLRMTTRTAKPFYLS